MNKSKAKRLRKELEHQERAADRGYAVQLKLQAEARRRRELQMLRSGQLTLRQLTDVQKAVHFEDLQETARVIDAQPVPTDGRQIA